MKRVFSALLCLLMTVCVLCGSVSAAKKPKTKQQLLTEQARSSYTRSLRTAGKSSFHGYCGLMTSHQMWALGINRWCATNNGNNQFDYYADMETTSAGYYITPYYAADYSMEEALNDLTRHGTRDVYNILVGFQRTNTEAGKRYGHAVLINGILDGTVYFVESYNLSLGRFYPEGSVVTCSIKDFADYYARWTTYEGLIWFGNGSYSDGCDQHGTDLIVQSRFASTLRSEPCVVGQNDCVRLREIAAGERLRAIAVLENEEGDLYYRVEDGGKVGYIAAAAVYVQRVCAEDLTLQNRVFPNVIRNGEDARLGGTVFAKHGNVSAVEIAVTGSNGQHIKSVRCEASGYRWDVSCLNEQLKLETLTPGTYTVALYAESDVPVIQRQTVQTMKGRILLYGQTVQVSADAQDTGAQNVVENVVEQSGEGWILKKDAWYFYRDGQPVTGWLTDCGVQYYLNESGAAVTGQTEVDGKQLCFSDTGVMVTGWQTLEDATFYRQADGTVVTGWQTIGNGLYCFDKDGEMMTGKTVKKDGVRYVLAKDGRATVKK